jgi:DNA-binding GntR family transcriptional regulator
MVSAVDAVRRALADDIVTGRLPPGTRLEETILARRYGVSRTPVREAVRQLAATGLVQLRLRKGAVVADTDADELGQLFEALGMVEALCAELAARRMTSAERRRLADSQRGCVAAADAGDRDAYAAENLRFHDLIYDGARNRPLRAAVEAIRLRLQPFRNAAFRAAGGGQDADRMTSSVREHEAIVAAVLAEDAAAASRAAREHIATSGVAVVDFFLSARAAPAAADGLPLAS